MNVRNLSMFLLSSLIFAACGDASTGDDQPADPETGLETLDAKDDSFAIRPGSPEAAAVVSYLNQPIADNAAGDAYRTELDSVLYRTAANNIADFRAGDDGDFGTVDDNQFDDITQVDEIRFVGRTSLMRLFELAEANGYFQRASVNCADYLEHDRYNNYYVDSYADLLEVENSRCTQIDGNLYINIRGTDLLPPSARAVDHLRHLVTIDGNVEITTSNVFDSVHFDSLETVTGNITAHGRTGQHTLEFDALTEARAINIHHIESLAFPSLEYNANILLEESDYTGFTALSTAGRIQIKQQVEGSFELDFPALTEVQNLQINVSRMNRYQVPDTAFTGEFSALEHAGSISLNEGKYAAFTWPSLKSVDNLRTTRTFDVFAGMEALEDVVTLVSQEDNADGGVHIGPPNLQTLGSLSVNTQQPVDGYNAVATVENSVSVTSYYGVKGFDAVESIGGAVSLNIGRSRTRVELDGFNSAVSAGSITVTANNTEVVVGDFFQSLEFTDSNVSLLSNGNFDKNPVFASLIGIGGQLRIDSLRETNNPMPVLEIVDGSVTINYTPEVFTGFDNLEHIEGTLMLKRSMNSIDGFGSLFSVGGNLSVPRSLDATELDDFLNQLTEFSGTINYN